MRRPFFALTVVFAGAMISAITACGSDDASTPVANADDASALPTREPSREAGVDASARDAGDGEHDASLDAAPDALAPDASSPDAASHDAHAPPPPPFTNPTVPLTFPGP